MQAYLVVFRPYLMLSAEYFGVGVSFVLAGTFLVFISSLIIARWL